MTEKFESFGSTSASHHRSDAIASADEFGTPDDVLHHPALTKAEKRALLAAYASDIRTVKGDPGLRQLDNGTIVEVDDIMRALRALDESGPADATPRRPYVDRGRRLFQASRWSRRRAGRKNGSDDDNNQPPPCPAVAYPRSRLATAFHHGRPELA